MIRPAPRSHRRQDANSGHRRHLNQEQSVPAVARRSITVGTNGSNPARSTGESGRLVYWAGGNPFHHHQDLNRLRRIWERPETIIVHEPWWTATARHADIVLPATTSLERNDAARRATGLSSRCIRRSIR